MKDTIRLQRSRFAYRNVVRWDKSFRDEATKRVKGLPVQVRTQGLGIVLATLLSQDQPETLQLANVLAEWLLQESPRKILPGETGSDGRKLLDSLMTADRSAYAAAQQEAIAVLSDIKSFAQALDEPGGRTNG